MTIPITITIGIILKIPTYVANESESVILARKVVQLESKVGNKADNTTIPIIKPMIL